MPRTRKMLETFMHATGRAAAIWGPAARTDPNAPVLHKHDAYEDASDVELTTFEVVTDSDGHHYAVRKDEKPPRTHH